MISAHLELEGGYVATQRIGLGDPKNFGSLSLVSMEQYILLMLYSRLSFSICIVSANIIAWTSSCGTRERDDIYYIYFPSHGYRHGLETGEPEKAG